MEPQNSPVFAEISELFRCDSGVFYTVTSMAVLVSHQQSMGLNWDLFQSICHGQNNIGLNNTLQPFAYASVRFLGCISVIFRRRFRCTKHRNLQNCTEKPDSGQFGWNRNRFWDSDRNSAGIRNLGVCNISPSQSKLIHETLDISCTIVMILWKWIFHETYH